jgi:hypothetical protein
LKKERRAKISCSFCGKSQGGGRKVIAGPSVYICDQCVRQALDLISERELAKAVGDDQHGTPAALAALVRKLEGDLREIRPARPLVARARALALGIEAATGAVAQ